MEQLKETTGVITPATLLNHWQGHRSLTRKTIEAFPEEALFTFSVGGMRPFAELAMEIIDLTGPGIKGLVTGEWGSGELPHLTGEGMPKTKEELLIIWDDTTKRLDAFWSQIPVEKYHDNVLAFGQYPGTVLSTIFYYMDNEIHHRGQGYVYLRALGIEPPFFWERA